MLEAAPLWTMFYPAEPPSAFPEDAACLDFEGEMCSCALHHVYSLDVQHLCFHFPEAMRHIQSEEYNMP